MMRYTKLIVLTLAIVLTLTISIKMQYQEEHIEFYVIRHDKENMIKATKELSFTESDMESYNWKSHEIVFTQKFIDDNNVDLTEELLIEGGSKVLDCNGNDKFIVFVNNEKIYEGIFEPSMYQSYLPEGPILSDTKNGVEISVHWGDDPRSNEKLYEALRNNKLLK